YLEDFYQAQVEVDNLLKTELSNEQKFNFTLFKGNILQTMKKLDEAITIFEGLEKEYPQLSEAQKVGTLIAACYEEKQDYAKAIEILSKLRNKSNRPDFIDLKIRRLKERQRNLP